MSRVGKCQQAGGGIRLVERTNNILENFFHNMKHGERRRSGRKILTQDFEHLPPAAALAYNLRRDDYVAILCGSLEKLPEAFAQLDAQRRRRNSPAIRRSTVTPRHASGASGERLTADGRPSHHTVRGNEPARGTSRPQPSAQGPEKGRMTTNPTEP